MFKNVKKEEITIPAQMSHLVQIREFIEHIGKKFRYHDKLINSFKLVVDEACTNIIRHGYRDVRNGEITLRAIVRRLSLTIVVIDQGTSYDPRQANTPDLAKYVDIGKKGGLGIMMMRKLMDDLQYTVTPNGNEFRLTKYREQSHENKILGFWNTLNLKVKYSVFAAIIYTVLAFFAFVPYYFGLDDQVTQNALNTAAGANLSLADNSVDDILGENSTLLFEKAISVRNANPGVIEEVFIVDTASVVLAWGNLEKSYSFKTYEIPENAGVRDSIGNVAVHTYSIADSIRVYDLSKEILLGSVTPLGQVHIWINQKFISDTVYYKKIYSLITLLLILLAGITALSILISRILTPFHSLADWVRQVGHGKIDQDEIDIDGSDEIGEIATAFNEMTHKFREAQVGLMERQKLQKELQVAQEIQQMLLPSDFPKVEGFEIASYYEAAKEVGGDLFDFVEVDEDSMGIIVADVSGKGVPGSLIMTMIRTALRLESRGNKNPAEVLAKVNRFVADDMKRGMFVTMFYIILDSRLREIHFASAGHNPMILYRGSTKQTYYLNPSGFPVGIQLPDIELFSRKIQSDSIRLREDDILVLYTDGITEAMNNKRELFREERFLDTIKNNSHLNVGEFVKTINRDLKNFTGGAPQNDDITYVAVKEKMMSGEVVYKLQEELFNLINSGVSVKQALEQLRISPHQYYKYKDIIARKGMAGLKTHLEELDYIEKKHISIELKTKIFDIISKHPDWGPKLISYELRTATYGKVKVDPDRIYNELVKLRLNTQKLRERYISKGDKKRIKQPGTPLMTLDGKVILDFESSESEVAKGHSPEKTAQMNALMTDPGQSESRAKITTFSSEPEIEDSSATFIHNKAKPFEPQIKEEKPEPEKPVKPEKIEEKSKPKPKQKEIVKPEKPVQEEVIIPEPVKVKVKPVIKEPVIPIPAKNISTAATVSSDKLKKKMTPAMETDDLDRFYQNIDGDLIEVEKVLQSLGSSPQPNNDIKKINVIFKIILKHPNLKKLTEVGQVFSQVQQIFDFVESNFELLDIKTLSMNLKDLLKYVEKDNKFNDYSKVFESINQIGLIQHQLNQMLRKQKPGSGTQLDLIREKLLNKNIISDASILHSMAPDKKD